MRFAVHRPGCPVASPRSHGVPRRDVDGRVHVRVAGETAGGAPEDGLALTRVPMSLDTGPSDVLVMAANPGLERVAPAALDGIKPAVVIVMASAWTIAGIVQMCQSHRFSRWPLR
jgi:hypothetical protein